MTKTIDKKQLEKLPEEFSLDELVRQLILIQKVEKGLLDSNAGRFISEEELEKEIDKWFE